MEQILHESERDIQVKLEGSAANLSPEERNRRQQCLERWIRMNTDPVTKQGRYVFRRGCHARSITYLLGGSPTEPWPRVENIPINEHMQDLNRFIQKGEFYVAGNECFNSFGPRFPGDTGLVNANASHINPNQTEFHLFQECSTFPHAPFLNSCNVWNLSACYDYAFPYEGRFRGRVLLIQ